MAFWTTNFDFVFYARYMLSNKFIIRNKNMFKIVIRTLEIALAAVNYFRKKVPSYMFDSVLNTPL